MSAKILVVDDEQVIVETIAYNLQRDGYEVFSAHDGETALALAREHQPQLIILDLMLPKISGWEICRELRQDRSLSRDIPILMLTARGEEADKVIGFDVGADDYVVKPFGMRELLARVRALLRRAATENTDDDASETLQIGPISLDTTRHEVHMKDEDGGSREIKLPFKEFELLRVLMTQNGKVVPRNVLLERVWGDDFFGDERTLDVHIRWLREKIEVNSSSPALIHTVRGVGYKFKA
jgi:DNA-binding response OmpR family regulator